MKTKHLMLGLCVSIAAIGSGFASDLKNTDGEKAIVSTTSTTSTISTTTLSVQEAIKEKKNLK